MAISVKSTRRYRYTNQTSWHRDGLKGIFESVGLKKTSLLSLWRRLSLIETDFFHLVASHHEPATNMETLRMKCFFHMRRLDSIKSKIVLI